MGDYLAKADAIRRYRQRIQEIRSEVGDLELTPQDEEEFSRQAGISHEDFKRFQSSRGSVRRAILDAVHNELPRWREGHGSVSLDQPKPTLPSIDFPEDGVVEDEVDENSPTEPVSRQQVRSVLDVPPDDWSPAPDQSTHSVQTDIPDESLESSVPAPASKVRPLHDEWPDEDDIVSSHDQPETRGGPEQKVRPVSEGAVAQDQGETESAEDLLQAARSTVQPPVAETELPQVRKDEPQSSAPAARSLIEEFDDEAVKLRQAAVRGGLAGVNQPPEELIEANTSNDYSGQGEKERTAETFPEIGESADDSDVMADNAELSMPQNANMPTSGPHVFDEAAEELAASLTPEELTELRSLILEFLITHLPSVSEAIAFSEKRGEMEQPDSRRAEHSEAPGINEAEIPSLLSGMGTSDLGRSYLELARDETIELPVTPSQDLTQRQMTVQISNLFLSLYQRGWIGKFTAVAQEDGTFNLSWDKE